MLVIACVTLALFALVEAAPSSNFVHKVKESFTPPRGWTKRDPAPAHHSIELRIALPQPNFPLLEQHLYEIRCVIGVVSLRGP